MEKLSADRARRVALAAQGFATPRPRGRVDRRHVRRLLDRTGVLQIDSVNVLVRAQEMPLFSRLGPHPRDLLPRMTADAELFEYWAHQASLVPVELHPLFRWRMEEMKQRENGSRSYLEQKRPGYLKKVLAEVRARGPVTAAQLEPGRTRKGSWWDWDDAKRALEVLFWCGALVATRGRTFERIYDLPERVLPADVLAQPTPEENDAKRELLLMAARSLGIATIADLAYYYGLNMTRSRPLVAELVEDGELIEVAVEGWGDRAYVTPEVKVPRRVGATTLVSPFDPLMWERKRVERVFDFVYRIEIYVPAPDRVYGYYVLPFLYDDRLVARVDLKADRKRSTLVVPGAFAEAHLSDEGLHALAAELRVMADWLELEHVEVADHGDLGGALRVASKRAARR
jgi:uncharacterized protein YcaQ